MIKQIMLALVIGILLGHTYAYGQDLQLSAVPSGKPVFQLLEVFSVNIHNVGGKEAQVYLSAKLFNDSGLLLFEGKSKAFGLAAHSRLLNINLLNAGSYITPYTTRYQHPSIATTTMSLPAANYKICVQIFDLKENVLLGPELCYSRGLAGLEPPVLVSPFDGVEVGDFPLFTWTPPLNFAGSEVKYDLTLVEMQGNQSAFAALQSNPPIYQGQNISTTIQQLPPYIQLTPCITYAWQVSISGQKKAGNDPISTFRKKCPDIPDKKIPSSFAALKKQADGGYYLAQDGILKFKFVEEYHKDEQAKLSYTIRESALNQTVAHASNLPEIIAYGDNRYTIDFSNYLSPEKFYYLDITDSRNVKYFLRFKCIYP